MRLIDETSFDGAGRALKNFGKYALSVPIAAVTVLAVAGANPAAAATVDVFLIADHTAPAPGLTAPLSITTTKVYQLGLRSDRKASAARLVDNFTVDVAAPLTFNNDDYNNGVFEDPTDLTDMGETGQGTAALVDAEVATWDNVHVPGSGAYDPAEQIDFGRNAPVIFNPVAGGFTDLIVAEMGGLNPFDLFICADAACSTLEQVFAGFTRSLSESLDAMPDFTIKSDSGPESQLDQTWLFRFSAPVYGFARVLENDKRGLYTNERLKVDFIGAGGLPTMTPVPVPTSLPLMASGLGLMGLMLRRRKSRQTAL